MENILDIAKQNNLNLTEVCILVQLDKKYPRAVSLEGITNDEKTYQRMMKSVRRLVAKNFIDIRGEKYRLKK